MFPSEAPQKEDRDEEARHIRRTPDASAKNPRDMAEDVHPDAVDLAALEMEVEQTRARLARIIGAADQSLAGLRRRQRIARRVATTL